MLAPIGTNPEFSGRFLGIEIKRGKEKQSEFQKAREIEIKNRNGIYLVVRSLEEFKHFARIDLKRSGCAKTTAVLDLDGDVARVVAIE